MKFLNLVAGVLASFVIAASGSAAVVYQNGTLNGAFSAESIGPDQAVSNSFSLSSASRLTSATIGLWTAPETSPFVLTWSIGTSAFANNIGGGTTSLSNVFAFNNGFFDIYLSSFGLDVTVGAGEYWLTLTDGLTNLGGRLFWDVNGGPSQAQFRNAQGTGMLNDSEYFMLEGVTATDPGPGPNPVPEPASMMLLAVGMIGVAASRRRYHKAA